MSILTQFHEQLQITTHSVSFICRVKFYTLKGLCACPALFPRIDHVVLSCLWPAIHVVFSVSIAFLQLSSWQNCNLPLAFEPYLNIMYFLGSFPWRQTAHWLLALLSGPCLLFYELQRRWLAAFCPCSITVVEFCYLLPSWNLLLGGRAAVMMLLPSGGASWNYQWQGRVILGNGRWWPGTSSVLN